MTTIPRLEKADALALERRVRETIHAAATLEDAAQRYTQVVYKALRDSIVLVRVFATVPFAGLPASNQTFVRAVARAARLEDSITDHTLVLSLLGTMGVEPIWCDRRMSVNHVGIPLISRDFVTAIPMIWRLLEQLGVDLGWIGREDTAIVGKTFGFQSGVFHVADATTAVDSRNRKIIGAQEFVARHAIKTVFGVGGGYVGTPVYATIICFCRDAIDEASVEGFRAHIACFEAETEQLAKTGKIFVDA
jgi:hypothetical protein